jgi:hypothetical protein
MSIQQKQTKNNKQNYSSSSSSQDKLIANLEYKNEFISELIYNYVLRDPFFNIKDYLF